MALIERPASEVELLGWRPLALSVLAMGGLLAALNAGMRALRRHHGPREELPPS